MKVEWTIAMLLCFIPVGSVPLPQKKVMKQAGFGNENVKLLSIVNIQYIYIYIYLNAQKIYCKKYKTKNPRNFQS